MFISKHNLFFKFQIYFWYLESVKQILKTDSYNRNLMYQVKCCDYEELYME